VTVNLASDSGQRVSSSATVTDFDIILVGGGLANSLIAWRLMTQRPELRVLVIERGETLGGNHTWSFHQGDVCPAALEEMRPFIAASWDRQSVHFPAHSRVFDVGYHAISSEKMHEVLSRKLGDRLILDTDVVTLAPTQVTLADQRILTAKCVIDGRGPDTGAPLALGFQKFLGLEVETEHPHGETIAVIMDATVEQLDGYRFFYTLPFSPTRILIEDTYYSDGPELNVPVLTQRVQAYATAKGWRIKHIVRDEKGVLPVVLAGDMDGFWQKQGSDVPRVGLRASLFHPTTGYSLPDALAFADSLAKNADLSSAGVRTHVEHYARNLWKNRAFFRLLNRMMFIAATPVERVRILERFYRLPSALIDRFFAAKLTMADKALIMMYMAAKPPLPFFKAVGVVSEAAGWTFARRTPDTRT
jgi:lycopene beta-cyclase